MLPMMDTVHFNVTLYAIGDIDTLLQTFVRLSIMLKYIIAKSVCSGCSNQWPSG